MPDTNMPLHTGQSAIYMAGRQEWNERYGSYIARARHWRIMAFVLAGTTAISTCCAVWKAQQAHVVPYVEQVNQLGEVVAVHAIPIAPPVDAVRIKAQLAQWVSDIRTVYTDPKAELNIATEAYNWTDQSSDATLQLDTWFRTNNPNERAQKETVGVAIENVGPIGADTWQIDWHEEHLSKDGRAPVTGYWRATVRIKVKPPQDEKTMMSNPNGVYVEWFSVTPRIQ